jgi:hypothetical protein
MIRFTVVSFALIVLLAPATRAVAQTVYEEGDFELATWTVFDPFITPQNNLGGGDFDAATPTSGGNPDGYLRLTLTGVAVEMGNSSLVWALLINDDAEYEPGTLGAIERVDFDFDARLPPEGRGNRAVTLAVEQGRLCVGRDRQEAVRRRQEMGVAVDIRLGGRRFHHRQLG